MPGPVVPSRLPRERDAEEVHPAVNVKKDGRRLTASRKGELLQHEILIQIMQDRDDVKHCKRQF